MGQQSKEALNSGLLKWKEMGDRVMDLFRLKTQPFGYKRLEMAEELDLIPNVRRLDHFYMFCQMLSGVRKYGLTMGAKNTDRMFSHCAQINGLIAVPPDRDGSERLRWVRIPEDGRKRFKAFSRIPPGEAIVLAPLSTLTFDPDVIMIYGTPGQIMLMIESIQRVRFELFEFTCIGESSCADSLAACYLTGKPKVGLPCYGELRNGQADECEIALALPPSYLEMIPEGWAEMRERGVTYPVTYIGWDLDTCSGLRKAYPDDPEFVK